MLPVVRVSLLAVALLTGMVACAPDSPSTLIMRGSTDHLNSRETVKVTLGVLKGPRQSAFFSSNVLPQTTITVHTSGRIWVARGTVQLSFIDRDGQTQILKASPGEPGQWKADIRTRPNQDKKNGFTLWLQALDGQPPEAEGIVMEVIYKPG